MADESLASLFRPAILKAAEEAFKTVGKDLTASVDSVVVQALAVGANAGIAQIAVSFLRVALGSGDATLEAKVAKLQKQHLIAGIRELRRVLELTPANSSELTFRAQLATSARSKLEDAKAVLDLEERPQIDLLMGVTACLIPGAEEDGIFSLQEYAFAVDTYARSLDFRAQIYEVDGEGLAVQAKRFANEGFDLLRSERLERRSREEKTTASRFRARADELRKTSMVVRNLMAALQERRQSRSRQEPRD